MHEQLSVRQFCGSEFNVMKGWPGRSESLKKCIQLICDRHVGVRGLLLQNIGLHFGATWKLARSYSQNIGLGSYSSS